MRILDPQRFSLRPPYFLGEALRRGWMLGQAKWEPNFRGPGEEENLIKMVHKHFVLIDQWEQVVQVIL